MYNKVVLVGNLTRDIEVRYSQNGNAIGNAGLAINRKFKTQAGEQKEEVMFIDVTFFGRTAEVASQYLKKGSKILIDGRLKLENWTAQDGTKRSKHSITVEQMQMLGNKDEMQGGGNAPQAGGQAQSTPQATPEATPQPVAAKVPEIDINEDEIPF